MAMRTVVNLVCPGSLANATPLTNSFTTQLGIGNPTNTGICPISIAGLDVNGQPLQPDQVLNPGESVTWFTPPDGSVMVVVTCFDNCSDQGQLTYDTSNA